MKDLTKVCGACTNCFDGYCCMWHLQVDSGSTCTRYKSAEEQDEEDYEWYMEMARRDLQSP